MSSARKGADPTSFPPGKSPEQIALIVAELGEELGVWSKDVAGGVPEMVSPAADARRRPGKRRPTAPPTAPRRTTPPPLARASQPGSFEHDVDFTSLHGAEVPTAPEDDTVDLIAAELLEEPREQSVLEVAPEELVEFTDHDIQEDTDDDTLDPLEVSFIEFLDQADDDGDLDDLDDLDDLETIEPISHDRPPSTAAYPPGAAPRSPGVAHDLDASRRDHGHRHVRGLIR